MKLYSALKIIGGLLCISVQVDGSPDDATELVEGTAAWQRSFTEALGRYRNLTNSDAQKYHHNDTDYDDELHKRVAIDTIYPNDPGDMHYYASFWKAQDCKGKKLYDYKQWMFISSRCQVLKEKATSFALMGNLDDCAHFWYWDSECSDPSELNAVYGDISCYNGPGAPGQQQIGSFKIMCKDSLGA